MADFGQVSKGVLIMFLGLLFTSVAWYTIDPILSIVPYDPIKYIFYIGLMIVAIFSIIVAPIQHVLEGIRS